MRQSEEFHAKARYVGISLMVALGAALLYLVYQATQFDDLVNINALDMAQISRNVARGDGFTTKFIRPLTLAVNENTTTIAKHPDLVTPPLHPLLTAGLFKVFGASARVAAWACGLCFLLTIGITYWLAIRVFSGQVATLAMVMVATDTALLQYAVSGLETSLLTLLVTLLFLVLFTHWQAKRYQTLLSAIAGAVACLIYLTQYAWLVIWLPVLLVIIYNAERERKLTNAIVFVVISVLVGMPWFVRNYNITGDPFFTYRWTEAVMGTMTHSANTLFRTWNESPPGFISFAMDAPREMYQKVRTGLLYLRPVVVDTGGPFIAVFFWVAILIPLGGLGFERIRKAVYATIVLLTIVLSVLGASGRLVAPLAPFMTVVGLALFCELLNRRVGRLPELPKRRWRSTGTAILLAVHIIPLALVMMPGFPTYYTQGVALQRAANELNSFLEEGRPVITDVPWVVAWYADRPAIWLPFQPVDARRIESEIGRVDSLLLTPALVTVAENEKATDWARAWQRALTEDIRYQDWTVDRRLANAAWILFKRVP